MNLGHPRKLFRCDQVARILLQVMGCACWAAIAGCGGGENEDFGPTVDTSGAHKQWDNLHAADTSADDSEGGHGGGVARTHEGTTWSRKAAL